MTRDIRSPLIPRMNDANERGERNRLNRSSCDYITSFASSASEIIISRYDGLIL